MAEKKKRKEDEQLAGNEGVLACAMCGSKDVYTSMEDFSFEYGVDETKVNLSAKIPVRTCGNCGFKYRDAAADRVCHEAICHHIGVMTPTQIRSLRGMYRLTQAEFAAVTKLGEATLSRWERGTLIQNGAYDNYLYLVGFSDNMDKLRDRAEGRPYPTADAEGSSKERSLTRRIPSGFPAFKCKGVYAT